MGRAIATVALGSAVACTISLFEHWDLAAGIFWAVALLGMLADEFWARKRRL